MFEQLWTGQRFVARSVRSGDTWSSSSLLDLMPIMPGERLPEPVSEVLAAGIEQHLLRLTCEASGFAENFDALTGAGLRDRAHTWTASGYLLLAEAHAAHRRR